MSSLRGLLLRFVLGLAAALLVFLDVQALLQTLQSQARVRERVVAASRDAVLAVRPQLQTLLAEGGDAGLQLAAQASLRAGAIREFEVFDALGVRRFSYPGPAPVVHWLAPADLAGVVAGRLVVVGPVAGSEPRLLAYLQLPSRSGPSLLRFALPVPEVVQDLRERREILVAHAVSLAVVIVGVAFLLLPRRETVAPVPRVLDAYEQAMERLRDQGQALSREHEAERLQLQERLAASAPMARAGELTAGMAHEVRNGLGTILGYARLIERAESVPDVRGAAGTIREECEALDTVVRRFVDFVKDETLRLEAFDLRRLLSRVAARESRSRPGAQVVLEPGDEVRLEGDEEMLERAFENVVRNALEAAGPTGHVSIAIAATGAQARVTVSDDGPGLSVEARARLRPFLTTKPGGLGLGLPMVYKIVGLHRGEILMGDRPPHGLALTLVLPLNPATGVTGSSASREAPAPQENS